MSLAGTAPLDGPADQLAHVGVRVIGATLQPSEGARVRDLPQRRGSLLAQVADLGAKRLPENMDRSLRPDPTKSIRHLGANLPDRISHRCNQPVSGCGEPNLPD